jgi:hypothetical protein
MSKTKTKFELVEYNKADEKKRDNRGKMDSRRRVHK